MELFQKHAIISKKKSPITKIQYNNIITTSKLRKEYKYHNYLKIKKTI